MFACMCVFAFVCLCYVFFLCVCCFVVEILCCCVFVCLHIFLLLSVVACLRKHDYAVARFCVGAVACLCVCV